MSCIDNQPISNTSSPDKKRSTRDNKERRSRKRKKKSPVKILLLSLLFVFIFAIGYGSFYVYNLLDKVDTEDISKTDEDLGIVEDLKEKFEEEKGITNIALFGVDNRKDEKVGRSDTMIILTIDHDHKKLKLTSLMRDSYVSIDGHKKDKLNHSYAYGGPQLTIKTINQNFNLNIEDFVTVDFGSLEKIIDAVGGITLEIKSDELQHINETISNQAYDDKIKPKYIPKAGTQRLSGMQALAYSRVRATSGGDYERTSRQRIVLEAIFQQVRTTGITKFPKLVNDLIPYVKTSLSSTDILKLGTSVLTSGISTIEQQRFPLDEDSKEGFIGKGWYIRFDEEATKKKIHDYIFDDIDPMPKTQNAGTGNNQ